MSSSSVELLRAAVADAVERGGDLKLTEQHARLVPQLAVHNNRSRHRAGTAELQIGQVHLKVDILPGAGGMQQLVYVQTHSTPRNDTSSIIADTKSLVKHFLTNILTFFQNRIQWTENEREVRPCGS